MRIETFEMERMQSTWENLVEYDMSESGVRPVTLRELMELGFDLDGVLDMPLGYSQSNGTLELREILAAAARDDALRIGLEPREVGAVVAIDEKMEDGERPGGATVADLVAAHVERRAQRKADEVARLDVAARTDRHAGEAQLQSARRRTRGRREHDEEQEERAEAQHPSGARMIQA